MSLRDDGFSEFCGGLLWNNNVTWWTNQPDFTVCFRNTVLKWVGAVWLLLTALPYIWYVTHQASVKHTGSKLSRIKIVSHILCCSSVCLHRKYFLIGIYGSFSHN